MNDISTGLLIFLFILMLAVSAFFASTETALMSLNRYRLRHNAQSGNHSARMAEKLLARPDRLIGVILLGNTFANFAAAALAGVLALRVGGDVALAIATSLAAIAMFIVGDLAPKTYGALHPERLALPAAWIYAVLVRVLYPIVWGANLFANGLLKLVGASMPKKTASHSLSVDELRTVVAEASTLIPHRHQQMLMAILDLEKITVEDIMIPRHDIDAINIEDEWDDILEQLRNSQHTRLPVYEGTLDNIIGLLHLRKVAQGLARGELTKQHIIELVREREPYFIPQGTTLNTQLLNFQSNRRRLAIVVNEYGDLEGLVTLEDILEEIVGEFTTDPTMIHKDVHREPGGSFVVNGGITIRKLNRVLGWHLPTDGPRTLNGVILEYLEAIPAPGTSMKLGNYSVEILQTVDNAVKTARLRAIADTESESQAERV